MLHSKATLRDRGKREMKDTMFVLMNPALLNTGSSVSLNRILIFLLIEILSSYDIDLWCPMQVFMNTIQITFLEHSVLDIFLLNSWQFACNPVDLLFDSSCQPDYCKLKHDNNANDSHASTFLRLTHRPA